MNIVYADADGRLYDSQTLLAAGRTGRAATWIDDVEWIPLPEGAALVSLPHSRALGFDPITGALKAMPAVNHAVGALLPQGFTRLYLPAYHKQAGSEPYPLFGYTAVGFDKGRFYVAATQSDDPTPWNPLQYTADATAAKVANMRQKFPQNRLYEHLSQCALDYECMTARNTFFARQEGAIPVSSTCNARCIGCISEQPDDAGFVSPQTRLTVRPSVDEMVELMVHHLRTTGDDGVISFGQGCEGDPSLRGREIAAAIACTREATQTGAININTNAGLTSQIRSIVDAGLDLMRVSIISAMPDHYHAYYRPRGYTFADVEASARYASDHGVIVSLNYLNFPGVSDTEEEVEAMIRFVHRTGVRLVQLRNLNIDPDVYLDQIPERISECGGEPLGILAMIDALTSECPGLRIGSYTHPPSWYHEMQR